MSKERGQNLTEPLTSSGAEVGHFGFSLKFSCYIIFLIWVTVDSEFGKK